MTLDEFVTKYEGKFVEYHSYGTGAQFQCVDLCNQYIDEVLGLPAIIGTNAQDFPSKAGDHYDYILNTHTGVPVKGDLVIWGGTYGHIAIFVEGDANSFTSFDQNFPTGSVCRLVKHDYINPKVLGWLHPKQQPMDALQACMADREKFWKERDLCREELSLALERIKELEISKSNEERKHTEIVEDYKKQLADTSLAVTELITRKEELIDEINAKSLLVAKLESDLQQARDKIISLETDQPITYTLEEVVAIIIKFIRDTWAGRGTSKTE